VNTSLGNNIKGEENMKTQNEIIAQLQSNLDDERCGRLLHESLEAKWREQCIEARKKRDELQAEVTTLVQQRDELAAALEKCGVALETIYAAWENGDSCYENPAECEGFLGRAFRLSDAEDMACLEAMELAGIGTILRLKSEHVKNYTPSAILAARDARMKTAGAAEAKLSVDRHRLQGL